MPKEKIRVYNKGRNFVYRSAIDEKSRVFGSVVKISENGEVLCFARDNSGKSIKNIPLSVRASYSGNLGNDSTTVRVYASGDIVPFASLYFTDYSGPTGHSITTWIDGEGRGIIPKEAVAARFSMGWGPTAIVKIPGSPKEILDVHVDDCDLWDGLGDYSVQSIYFWRIVLKETTNSFRFRECKPEDYQTDVRNTYGHLLNNLP